MAEDGCHAIGSSISHNNQYGSIGNSSPGPEHSKAASLIEGDPLRDGCLIPGSQQKKMIFPIMPLSAEYQKSAAFVIGELKKAIQGHPDLYDQISCISYKLRMVGTSPDSAVPTIVVDCKKAHLKRLRELLNRKATDKLYCRHDSTRFQLFMKELSAAQLPFRLAYFPTDCSSLVQCANNEVTTVRISSAQTLCGILVDYGYRTATGSLILEVDGVDRLLTVDHLWRKESEAEPSHKDDHKGATGALLDTEAVHFCQLWLEDDDEYDEDSRTETGPSVCTRNCEPVINNSVLRMGETFPENFQRLESPISLPWSSPYLNWALVQLPTNITEPRRQNLIFSNGTASNPGLLRNISSEPRYHGVPVYMISGIRGVKPGRLLAGFCYLGSPPGQDLCPTWQMIPDFAGGIMPGECGSIIIDQETLEVYGHIIGSDSLGYAFIAPLTHTVDQIKASFNASRVELPVPLSTKAPGSKATTNSILHSAANDVPCQKSSVERNPNQVPENFLGDYHWEQPSPSSKSVNQPSVEIWGAQLDGTPLELFLQIPEGSPRSYYQMREIEAICPPQALEELSNGIIRSSPEPIVWLDDRSHTGKRREQTGYLTAASLSDALSAKRLQENESQGSDQPNADHRLIYIPNPDCRSLPAIVLTASCQQASVFGEFLWRYITADCSILVAFANDGRTFSLEFHLPFYIWKQAEVLLEDTRTRPNQSALRKSKLLSYLAEPCKNKEDKDVCECLYEAQWSVMVTGYNNTIWTGYGLTDTYCYGTNDHLDRSSIKYYEKLLEEENDICRDPITGLDANIPLGNPREYFLVALRNCLSRVKEEWVNIITRLEQKMDYYIEDKDEFLEQRPSSLLGAADDHSQSVQESYIWTKQVRRLLTNLTDKISNTNRSWKSFKARDFRYFDDMSQPRGARNRSGLHLHAVDIMFSELQSLLVRLENLRNKNQDFSKSLELYLLVENNRTVVLQELNINLIQIVTPPALAAGMMQSNVLPWNSGFAPWAVVTVVLWILAWAFRPLLKIHYRYKNLRLRRSLIVVNHKDSGYNDSRWQPDPLSLPQPTFARYLTKPFSSTKTHSS